MHDAFSKKRSGHAKSNQSVSSRPSSPHQNVDTTTHKDKRGSDGDVSPKPSHPPSPPTLSSHARQPLVEDSGTIAPSNCVNDVSTKRSAPPRPQPPSHVQVMQSSQKVRSYSFTTSSQTESKLASHTRSKSLFSHSHKSSSRAGSKKRRGCPLQRSPVVRRPITKHAITKSDDWDKEVYCEALYDFRGEMPCDLQFRKGQKITIVTRTDSRDDWWEGTVNGTTGIFPANYVSM